MTIVPARCNHAREFARRVTISNSKTPLSTFHRSIYIVSMNFQNPLAVCTSVQYSVYSSNDRLISFYTLSSYVTHAADNVDGISTSGYIARLDINRRRPHQWLLNSRPCAHIYIYVYIDGKHFADDDDDDYTRSGFSVRACR